MGWLPRVCLQTWGANLEPPSGGFFVSALSCKLARMSSARPAIRDPRAVPVVGVDDHLPPLSPAQLSVAVIRARMAQAAQWQAPIVGDAARPEMVGLSADTVFRPASVLLPLVARADGLHVLLTRRTEHLRDHAGQISFPGGRAEPSDADAVQTALREAQEEVGLAPHSVEILGQMPLYTTVTRYRVTPVVGLLDPAHQLQADAHEVAEVAEVPLHFLMTPAHHRRHVFEWQGQQREFLSMPWSPTPERPDAWFIWGATAAMLRNFYHLLAQ
jgi:8-oxo-dGTP pyrophosphatase MutT (NUDIX family)